MAYYYYLFFQIWILLSAFTEKVPLPEFLKYSNMENETVFEKYLQYIY